MAKQQLNDKQLDTADFGNVMMPNAGTTSVALTVTKRSVIHSFASSRLTSGTAGAYRVVVSTSNGSILKQVSTTHSQDQQYRYCGSTVYALVEPGTYTMTRTSASGTFDQDSIIAMAIPTPNGLN